MKLLVLDGNSILNRAFYGIKLLTTRDGLYTNGIYGFLNIFNKLMADISPEAVAVAFDLKAPTFRHLAYDGYKAGRKGMPEELHTQLPLLKELLGYMGIPVLEAEGFEADDILGTEAYACARKGWNCIIATGDRDSLQLVGDKIEVWLAGTSAGRPQTTIYNHDKIRADYGVEPPQLIDVKALMGDASDNIPGVPGIGQKTALDLIGRFGSLREVYERLDTPDIRESVKKKLREGRESAVMSRSLAEIRTDAPVTADPEQLRPAPVKKEELRRMMAKLEFFSLIEKMGLNSENDPKEVSESGESNQYPVVFAGETKELHDRLARQGKADFCFYGESGKLKAVVFAFDDGCVAISREGTADFDRLVDEIMRDSKIVKRTHDIKALTTNLSGSEPEGLCFDTMLAGYLINPLASGYDPERLCDELGEKRPSINTAGVDDAVAECAKKAVIVHLICDKMADQIASNGQDKLYYNIEIPLARVLARMESRGFEVDAEGIAEYGRKLENRLNEMQSAIFGMTGYEFNINSPKQLGEALFVKLGLPPKKRTKTGFSTNVEVLESLKGFHPIIELLLEYRQLSKLKSTYTDGLLKVVGEDRRIHSNFNQVETRTGRISSTEPNLQNIPVRSEAGRELRRFFIPAQGCELIDADYSQIELRILAHVAGDQAMQDAFNSHADIHTITASQVFRLPPEMVTPVLRSRAKAVNFGIVYGISAFSLSQDIGVSVKEADSYIKGYLETFSGVRNYMERVVKEAYDKGYVETLLGRRRMLPELTSSNRNIRNFGERVALNTPIQGTAADIIKIAMVRVDERLRREGLKSRLILQVHDELIVEAPKDEAITAAEIVEQEMENALPLSVRLEADVHRGDSWFTAKG